MDQAAAQKLQNENEELKVQLALGNSNLIMPLILIIRILMRVRPHRQSMWARIRRHHIMRMQPMFNMHMRDIMLSRPSGLARKFALVHNLRMQIQSVPTRRQIIAFRMP